MDNEVITFETIGIRMDEYVAEAVEMNPDCDYYEIDEIVRQWIESSDWVIYYAKAEQVARVYYEHDIDEYHAVVRDVCQSDDPATIKANLAYTFMYEIASWKLDSRFNVKY